MTLDTAVLADLAAIRERAAKFRCPATPEMWCSGPTDPHQFDEFVRRHRAEHDRAVLLAEVESLRKALTGLLNQYTDDTGNFHDACDERECAVARAVAVARAALVSEEGSR